MMRSTGRARALVLLLVAAAFTIVGAGAAAAQGLYYKEVRRQDRIYVFNIAANAERFERDGEMEAAITRPGAGPGGETVVADSARALELFFFKHGISEAVPDPAPPPARVEWRDGRTRITAEQAYLEISNRMQVRFTYTDPSALSPAIPGTAGPGEPMASFRLRHAKTRLEGWTLKPWLTYEVQLAYTAAANGNASGLIEDASFDIDASKGKGYLRLRVGQFKPPFGQAELVPETALQFVDRAVIHNEVFRGRDAGLAVWGSTPDNRLEWRVGVFNGNGITKPQNDNNRFQYNARVMWQPTGSRSLNVRPWAGGAFYAEGDFESTTTPIFAIAFNWERQDLFRATAGNDLKWNQYCVDGVFKFRGFAATALYSWADRVPETGTPFGSSGVLVQAGQLFGGRRYEVGVRYGHYDANDAIDDSPVAETRAVFSYYYARHRLKWQTDAGRVASRAAPGQPKPAAFEVRTQLQFMF